MPKYDADQTTALHAAQRCDEAGVEAQGRHGHAAQALIAAQPREGGATCAGCPCRRGTLKLTAAYGSDC